VGEKGASRISVAEAYLGGPFVACLPQDIREDIAAWHTS
jgi:hypothetical protein